MTIKVEVIGVEVKEAVLAHAKAMLPPGWFKCHSVDKVQDGFVVSFEPIPVSERPKPTPDVAPPAPGEFHEVFAPPALPAPPAPPALPPIGGFTNNGVLVRV